MNTIVFEQRLCMGVDRSGINLMSINSFLFLQLFFRLALEQILIHFELKSNLLFLIRKIILVERFSLGNNVPQTFIISEAYNSFLGQFFHFYSLLANLVKFSSQYYELVLLVFLSSVKIIFLTFAIIQMCLI